MHATPVLARSISAATPSVEPIDPAIVKLAVACFQAAKAALVRGNFSAYLAELHPIVFENRSKEQIAKDFSELRGLAPATWEMSALEWADRESNTFGGDVLMAPKEMAILFIGDATRVKLAYIGELPGTAAV